MTFSAGSRADPTPDIPFFGERDAASDRKNPGSVAVVRGKPAWMRPSDQSALAVAVVAGRPPPAAPYPRQHSHQPTATPPMQHRQQQPTNTREADVVTYSRHRHFSFDVDRTRDNLPPVAPAQEPIVRPPSGRRRRASRRRWLLPLPESPDVPRLFTPPAGSQFERIARHRDRAEAKVLMSACTYIEAELDRLSNQYQNVREGACCCKKDSQSPQPSCECGHRLFLATSAERLRGVLGILEDRYDSIEQVYVKSEEYAKAMGKFFQVSPNEFSRMVSDRELASRDSRKSIRS